MKTIRQTYLMKATPIEVWDALVNQETISAWGGGPAKMSENVGDAFSLWGGDIYGKNIQVIPQKVLKQEWYTKDDKQKTIVTFTLVPKGPNTEVQLLHEDVPDHAYGELKSGWKDYYLGPIKTLLGG